MQPKYKPSDCPVCEYDRQFPETEEGGLIYAGNNGGYWPCWGCNPSHPSFALTSDKRDAT